MSSPTSQAPLKAILVGIQLPGVTDVELKSSLDELERLVTTLGYKTVGRLWQKRDSDKHATVLGDGKLRELAKWTGGTGSIGPMVVKKKHKAALKREEQLAAEAAESAEVSDSDSVWDEGEETENGTETESDTETSADSAAAIPGEADITIFDCDLSPSQLRNIESATGKSALDRTGVIIEIFSRHAKTRAARLQVEIARLTYVAPRLRETGGDEDRGGGGVGGKGAGETSLELDRRKIRDRIKELKDEFEAIEREHEVRRARRDQENKVALVGYTNAGKSSLMRALTGSEVLVADKLFATLDTTVRQLHPESKPKILISDTVGFIKKLPHDLVASFKSTLDEALHASILLYVVDASDPTFRSQLQVTTDVIDEVKAEHEVKDETPSLLVLNKIDRVAPAEQERLRREFPHAVFLSALRPDDVAALRLNLIEHFEGGMIDETIVVPYTAKGVIGEIRGRVRVLSESYDERGTRFDVRGPKEQIDRIKAMLS